MTFEWKGRSFVLHREPDTRKLFSKIRYTDKIYALFEASYYIIVITFLQIRSNDLYNVNVLNNFHV